MDELRAADYQVPQIHRSGYEEAYPRTLRYAMIWVT